MIKIPYLETPKKKKKKVFGEVPYFFVLNDRLRLPAFFCWRPQAIASPKKRREMAFYGPGVDVSQCTWGWP